MYTLECYRVDGAVQARDFLVVEGKNKRRACSKIMASEGDPSDELCHFARTLDMRKLDVLLRGAGRWILTRVDSTHDHYRVSSPKEK
jgi:hypothetical protein